MGSLGVASGVVVVFDFDKTIVDCDSDNWVVDNLGVTEKFESMLQAMPWNTAIDKIMGELHSQGKSISDIADCLRTIPLDPKVVGSIRAAYALGCDLRIVSDANQFFITTILEHHNLLGYFTAIYTNPSYIDGDGRLRIGPYHRNLHGCPLSTCPPNMCKGRVIQRMKEEVGYEARFVYLGDGKGDFCPSLKLSAGDFVMPRKGYPVWELIQTRGAGAGGDPELVLKAEVRGWSSWAEQYETLLVLVQKAACSLSDHPVIPVDCSIHAQQAVLPESFPKPLSVNY